MAEAIFGWEPILWTARVSLLIVFGSLGLSTFLYFARFLRWKHFKAMLLSDPPRISHVEAGMAGNKVAIKLDQAQAAQIRTLADRVTELERAARAIEPVVLKKEGGDA